MDERVEALKAKLLQATALVKAVMPSPGFFTALQSK